MLIFATTGPMSDITDTDIWYYMSTQSSL